MSRESRLIVILVVIAAIGVSGLMVVANQYRKAMEHGEVESASARAARLVNGYLAARDAAKAVVGRYPGEVDRMASAYRVERSKALAAYGMTYEDYAAVRAAWRTYRTGGHVNDPALVAAFQSRSSALEGATLGQAESVDDAIR